MALQVGGKRRPEGLPPKVVAVITARIVRRGDALRERLLRERDALHPETLDMFGGRNQALKTRWLA